MNSFNHNYFATPPMRRSCAYLESLDKLAFGPKSGFKNWCRARAGFGLL